jgi:L-alanine-DL-glutamate epimerase-like enolase superfamily enzyme
MVGENLELKITDIKTATVVGNYYWTYVRVYAGEESGIGEGFFAPKLEGIIQELGRVILGENALDINRVYEVLRWAAIPSGASGSNYHAISAIEIAILDLVAKHLNIPVYTLLGGKYRDQVRLYVDSHAGTSLHAMDAVILPITPKWMQELGVKEVKDEKKAPIHGRVAVQSFTDDYTPEAYGKRAKQMKDEGYTAIKFDLDVPTPYSKSYNQEAGALSNQEVEYLAGLVAAVRDAVGGDVDILFDLHWRFDVGSSIRLAKAIERYNVMWLEDPVPPGNPEILKTVAGATMTPIATGENLYSRYGFAPLLNTGVRIITPDALKAGGLLETRFVAQMASMNEITISPHNISSPIGTMAQAHLSASIPNFGVLEFHGHDVPIWFKLIKKPLMQKGFIHLTDAPGLGVELDEEVAAKYALHEKFEL